MREAFQKVKRKETVDIIKSHLLLSSRNAGEYRPDAWKSKAAILRNLSVSMTELKARRMLKIDTGNLKCFLNLLALAERKMYQYWDNRGVGGAVVARSPRDLKVPGSTPPANTAFRLHSRSPYEHTLYSTTEYTDYLPWCFEYFYGVRKKSQGDCMLIQAWRSLDTRGHTNSL